MLPAGRKDILVAIVDNSIAPSVYKPVEHWAAFLGVPFASFRAAEGRLPDLGKEFTHVILTGSEASILEREPWVGAEVEFVREALKTDIPILGSCYGHQLLALAMRGPAHVRRALRPEVGWFPIEIRTESGLLGEGGTVYAFSSHFDEVSELDGDFRVLASTPGCAVQAAIVDGTLDPVRLHSLERLIEEEAALEEEQRAHDKASDRRAGGKTRPPEESEFDDLREGEDLQ